MAKKNVFLSGQIQVGKSTVLRKYLELSGLQAGGLITSWHDRGSPDRYLYISDYAATEEYRAAHRVCGVGLEVYTDVFNEKGPAILKKSSGADIIVIDELGLMEKDAADFQLAVFDVLEGAVPVIGVVRNSSSPFLDAIRSHPSVETIMVSLENRDLLPYELLKR